MIISPASQPYSPQEGCHKPSLMIGIKLASALVDERSKADQKEIIVDIHERN